MGFPSADRVFAPEKLPITEPLLPAINRSPDVAAHVNARVAARRKDQVCNFSDVFIICSGSA